MQVLKVTNYYVVFFGSTIIESSLYIFIYRQTQNKTQWMSIGSVGVIEEALYKGV
jgi:hypothetical protein